MTIRIPNRTAQAGTFYTGSPDYVDVGAGAALAGMVTFPAKATDDSWTDGDEVGVVVSVDDSNYQVWTATWDETNEYILLGTLEESVGTISDTAAVSITAALTSALAESLANPVSAPTVEVLTANRTYYVRTNGSDSNNGLANTSGGAFLTVQKAIDTACSINGGNYSITIQIADGTYSSSGVVAELKPYVGTKQITIQGNTSNETTVTLSSTANYAVALWSQVYWKLRYLTVKSTTSHAVYASDGRLDMEKMCFGICGVSYIYNCGRAHIRLQTQVSFNGNAPYALNLRENSTLYAWGINISCNTWRTYTAFLYMRTGAIAILGGWTFSGYTTGHTGKRYDVELNAVADVSGASTTYLPGDTAGTTATGGQYA